MSAQSQNQQTTDSIMETQQQVASCEPSPSRPKRHPFFAKYFKSVQQKGKQWLLCKHDKCRKKFSPKSGLIHKIKHIDSHRILFPKFTDDEFLYDLCNMIYHCDIDCKIVECPYFNKLVKIPYSVEIVEGLVEEKRAKIAELKNTIETFDGDMEHSSDDSSDLEF